MMRTPITTSASATPPRQVSTKASMRLVSVCVRDLLAAFGIDLGQRLEILVQRRAHGAVGVVVAPFAARGRHDLDAAADQLLAEFDELLDALLEGGELLGIVGLDDGLPVLTTSRIWSLNLSRPSPYFFTTAGFGRHVDAARFHHHRIDQRVDALDVERGAVGGLDRASVSSALRRRVVVGQHRDRRGQHREQREDRIELGGKRKPDAMAGGDVLGSDRSGIRSSRGRECRRPLRIMQEFMEILNANT